MVDFELIKGNISRYSLSSILKSSHELIVAVENAKDKQYPFWDILILIKWAYIYTKDSPFRKTATIKDVQNTMLLIRLSYFHKSWISIPFRNCWGTNMLYQQNDMHTWPIRWKVTQLTNCRCWVILIHHNRRLRYESKCIVNGYCVNLKGINMLFSHNPIAKWNVILMRLP